METNNNIEDLNLASYGYETDAEVVISGALMNSISGFLSKVSKEETEAYFSPKDKDGKPYDNEEAFFNQFPEVRFTSKGMLAQRLLADLYRIHESNIISGLAKPHSELQKPKVQLVNPNA